MTLVPAMAEQRRARDDAAALPDVRPRRPGPRPARHARSTRLPTGCRYPSCAGKNILLASAPTSSAGAGPTWCAALIRKATVEAAPRGRRRRRHFRPATTRGTSGSASSRTATCSARSAAGSAVGGHRHDRDLHARPASGSPRARSSRPTSSSPRPGCTCWPFGGVELSVDGAPVDLAETMAYKALMLSGVPELRLHDRLHQRLVDAQGRPGRRLRRPPAQPHGRARPPQRGAARAGRHLTRCR